jgi:hypothetical protein
MKITASNGSNVSAVLDGALNHPVSRVWNGYWLRTESAKGIVGLQRLHRFSGLHAFRLVSLQQVTEHVGGLSEKVADILRRQPFHVVGGVEQVDHKLNAMRVQLGHRRLLQPEDSFIIRHAMS